jgi:hypothetical protein
MLESVAPLHLLASTVTGKLSDSLYSNIRAIQRDRREPIEPS